MRTPIIVLVLVLLSTPVHAEEAGAPSSEAILCYSGAAVAMVNGAGLAFYGLIRPFTTTEVPSERGVVYMAGGIGLMGASVALFAVAGALPKNVEASATGLRMRF